MAIRVIEDTILQGIAEAIQEKDGGSKMYDTEMRGRIENILTTDLISKTKNVTDNQIKMLVYIDDVVANCYVQYTQSIANDVEVDWGDGSPIETSPKTGTGALNANTPCLSHNYSIRGYVIITLSATNGSVNTTAFNGFLSFRGADTSINWDTYPNNSFRHNVLGVAFGNNVDGNSVSDCRTLSFVKNIYMGAPDTSLVDFSLKTNISTFPVMSTTYIRNINIPETITMFPTNSLRSIPTLNIVDFTHWTIETLENCTFNSNVFYASGGNAALGHPIILFATQEIAEAAKQKTNLAVFADWITYEGA